MHLHKVVHKQDPLAHQKLSVNFGDFTELRSTVRNGTKEVSFFISGYVLDDVGILVNFSYVLVHVVVAVLVQLQFYVEVVVVYVLLYQIVVVFQRGVSSSRLKK